MEYKAITKTNVMPTRSNGMGKVMIEVIEVNLLSNTIILRDWVVIQDENGVTKHREMIKDYYPKQYSDESFSQIFSSTDIVLDSPQENYKRLKDIVSEAVVIMNNVDPPYSLEPDSFEAYVSIPLTFDTPNKTGDEVSEDEVPEGEDSENDTSEEEVPEGEDSEDEVPEDNG